MNITFLIGNGFDLALGLKTQYKDFYVYFIEKAEEDNMIKKWLVEAKDKDIYDTWADLEKALGVHTNEISELQSDEFIKSKIEMDNLLSDYLEKEQSKMQLDDVAMKDIMIDALAYIIKGNSLIERQRIFKVLEMYGRDSCLYYGISFNYTNCFGKFVKAVKELQPVIQTQSIGNSKYRGSFVGIEYIHGKLTDGEMILGVNDKSQIANSKLADIPSINRMLVKSELNTELGNGKIDKVKKIISSSKVICIYGMSLGDTDKMWWEMLGEWLLNDPHAILMIFKYDSAYTGRHAVEKIHSWEGTKEYFMSQSGVSEDRKKELKDQIVVYMNKNIWEHGKERLKQEEVG